MEMYYASKSIAEAKFPASRTEEKQEHTTTRAEASKQDQSRPIAHPERDDLLDGLARPA